MQVFELPPVRLQFGRHLLAFVIRLDPPGRLGRADHLARLLVQLNSQVGRVVQPERPVVDVLHHERKDDVLAACAIDDADQCALRFIRVCLLSDDLLGLRGPGTRDDPGLKGAAERFTRRRWIGKEFQKK